MSVFPTRLSFLRRIINKIRSLLWKILGVEQPRALIELLNEYPPQSIDNEQTMAYQLWKILGVEQPRGLIEQLSAFSPLFKMLPTTYRRQRLTLRKSL